MADFPNISRSQQTIANMSALLVSAGALLACVSELTGREDDSARGYQPRLRRLAALLTEAGLTCLDDEARAQAHDERHQAQ